MNLEPTEAQAREDSEIINWSRRCGRYITVCRISSLRTGRFLQLSVQRLANEFAATAAFEEGTPGQSIESSRQKI
jgi:hypothetical protein